MQLYLKEVHWFLTNMPVANVASMIHLVDQCYVATPIVALGGNRISGKYYYKAPSSLISQQSVYFPSKKVKHANKQTVMHRERKEKDKQTSLCVWQNVLACRPPLAPMVSRVEPPEKEPIRSSSFVKHTQKMMTIGTGNKSPLKQFLYPHQDEGSLRRNTSFGQYFV